MITLSLLRLYMQMTKLVVFCSLGVYIINLKKTWEKLLLAARAIVAIENPADVCVISSRNTGQVKFW